MNKQILLEGATSASHCIISVMGDHAGEDVATIFNRKIADVRKVKQTLWLIKSPKATPALVQKLCQHKHSYVLFIEPSAHGCAHPTKTAERAIEFSKDGSVWSKLPVGIGPVTGKLDTRAYALVIDALETVHKNVKMDIWCYADFVQPDKPVKMILGCSTICAIKKDMKAHPDKMKSRYRGIIAIARLAEPYCVWVR
jgi:hypothetical protein